VGNSVSSWKYSRERAVEEAEDSHDSDSEESARVLTTKGMAKASQHLRSFHFYLQDKKPHMYRSSQVTRSVKTAANCNKVLYNEKKKPEVQLPLGLFQQKGVAWHPSDRYLLLKRNK
jgi:hypothetical protein